MSTLAARVTVRVAVQSSQRLLRDTLAACLAIRPDVTVVGRVAAADEVVDLCELSSPDVVIMDAGRLLGEMAGRVRALVRRFPELNVILIYREASEEDLAAACRAGASSLIPESHGLAAVLAQVRRRKARHAREGQRSPGRQGLTDRELEIVVLTGSGHIGASALVAADRIDDHFLAVLRMVSQGYLVVDSRPMRPLLGADRVRWDEHATGPVGLPELTSRESDILSSMAQGHSIRQTARALGIAPKTVENVQTRLFRKLGVRNRSGALAVADAFGLLPATPPAGDPVCV